jgi:type I restriction enzyme, S subunit
LTGEWRDVALEDVADELTVGYVGPMASEYVDDGIPFLRSLNVEPLRINKNDLKFITPEFHQRIQKSRLTPGDIVIVRTGKPGACSVVPDWLVDANCSDLVIVRCGKLLNNRFLAYYVNTVASDHVAAHLVGAVQQHFNVGSARTLRLNLPPLEEQEAVASVLGALDDKIELNRRMGATLEAMARALFQSWFVDFDPVRAKLDGRTPVGLDTATAKLFPGAFQDVEGAHIPIGWTVHPVGEVVDCVGGGTPSTAEPKYWEGGTHHWTTPKDFSLLQAPILLDTDRKLTDAGIAKISSGLLPAGTLLLSSRAPVGYLAIAAMPVAINQGFIALKCNERASNFFMLNWCQTNMAEIESRATGTTFAEISKQNFRPIRVVLPPKALMATFTARVAPFYARITANLHQSRTLAVLRDALLPKLLSGALRVRERTTTPSRPRPEVLP